MTATTASAFCQSCLGPLPRVPWGRHCSSSCAGQSAGDARAIAYYTGRADARYGRPQRVHNDDQTPRACHYRRGYTDELAGVPW